jgi:uncharacterized protein
VQLQLHRPEDALTVRSVEPEAITVGDRRLARSFLLSAEQLVESWPVTSIETLDSEAVAAILALAPEVVILGTGVRQIFPPQRLLAEFLGRGVGIESMDNRAAARTYNVLVSEGRRAVVAFILP